MPNLPLGTVPPEIREGLGRLRQALQRWLLVDGLRRVLVVATVLVAVSLLVDRNFRMDQVQRFLSLLLALGGLGWLAWRRLLTPLRQVVSDEGLGRKVEQLHPMLEERVIAALELAIGKELPPGASPELVQATIAEGAYAAGRTDFSDVLDRKAFWRNVAQIGACLVLVGGSAGLFPATLSLWWQRNVLIQDVEWPRQTHLSIEGLVDGALRLPVEADLEIRVRAAGVQPDSAILQYRPLDGGKVREEEMALSPDGRFRSTFEDVLEPFEFRVRGGDDRTDWVPVVLLPRPELAELTLHVEPPAYTGRPAETFPGGISGYPVARGSQVRLQAVCTKPLAEVRLLRGDEVLATVRPEGATEFALAFPTAAVRSGLFGLRLEDTEAITGKRPVPIRLQVRPDRVPIVRARLEGIGSLALPRARLPLAGEMRDDHGLADAWIEWSARDEQGEPFGPGEVPLAVPEEVAASREVVVDAALDLQGLELPETGVVTFRLAGRDRNDLPDGPGVGYSTGFSVRLVIEEELREHLTRREQDLRLSLEAMLKEQRELLEDNRVWQVQGAETDRLDPSAQRELALAERRQRLATGRLERLCEQLAQIRSEVLHNRLEQQTDPLPQRLEQRIIVPLRLVARQEIAQAAAALDEALRQPDAAARQTSLLAAEDLQMRIVARYQDVLADMVKSEDVQKAIALLREIQEKQREVREQTEAERQKGIESIFGP